MIPNRNCCFNLDMTEQEMKEIARIAELEAILDKQKKDPDQRDVLHILKEPLLSKVNAIHVPEELEPPKWLATNQMDGKHRLRRLSIIFLGSILLALGIGKMIKATILEWKPLWIAAAGGITILVGIVLAWCSRKIHARNIALNFEMKMQYADAWMNRRQSIKQQNNQIIAGLEEMLEELYEAHGIIKFRYRNLKAITAISEYLMDGRCTDLEKAYALYETEVCGNIRWGNEWVAPYASFAWNGHTVKIMEEIHDPVYGRVLLGYVDYEKRYLINQKPVCQEEIVEYLDNRYALPVRDRTIMY